MPEGGLTESERIEREEFARGHLPAGEEPVEPRPAATVVMARDGGEACPLEALLLRRPDTARFAAGAWVFPGGAIDAGDRGARLGGRLAAAAGSPGERAAIVAALRECFEETGLLPADRLPDRRSLREAREGLLAGELEYADVVRRLDLTFEGLRAAYFARWVTPALLSRRYDARFFLVEHRVGEPSLIHDEHTEARWTAPAEALRQCEAGALPMLYPTRRTMEELAGFLSLDEAFAAFRHRRVEPVRPRLLVDGDRVIPVLPGDPRYAEAGPEGTRGTAEG